MPIRGRRQGVCTHKRCQYRAGVHLVGEKRTSQSNDSNSGFTGSGSVSPPGVSISAPGRAASMFHCLGCRLRSRPESADP
eukprot:scaffold1399_cov410-Prasinococcus_capsulatus_cf.AAC.19